MTCLEALNIENFRGFDTLEINDFSKINLFVGKNNVGKTSILESVFLITGMSNPTLPNLIDQLRGFNLDSPKHVEYLFHNAKPENKPVLCGKLSDKSKRRLEIGAMYQQSTEGNASVATPQLKGIEFNFSIEKENADKKQYTNSFFFENGKVEPVKPYEYREDLYGTFIAADNQDFGTLSRYSKIVKKKEGDAILKALQSFDGNIQGIQLLPDGIYFDMKDIQQLVPSTILGDGIRRFLNIVTAVLETEHSFVLIDEIENGLHYSAHRLLWKSILAFSEKNDVQLFITTHNIETLSRLKSILEEPEYASMQDCVKVFDIAKTLNKGYQAYKYSFEGFKDAIEQNIELRS